jgi:hypothetical protein
MQSTIWIIDNGAIAHFSDVREDFTTLNLADSGNVSRISIRVRGHGTCKLTLVDPAGKRFTVRLEAVLYVLDLALRSNGN